MWDIIKPKLWNLCWTLWVVIYTPSVLHQQQKTFFSLLIHSAFFHGTSNNLIRLISTYFIFLCSNEWDDYRQVVAVMRGIEPGVLLVTCKERRYKRKEFLGDSALAWQFAVKQFGIVFFYWTDGSQCRTFVPGHCSCAIIFDNHVKVWVAPSPQ